MRAVSVPSDGSIAVSSRRSIRQFPVFRAALGEISATCLSFYGCSYYTALRLASFNSPVNFSKMAMESSKEESAVASKNEKLPKGYRNCTVVLLDGTQCEIDVHVSCFSYFFADFLC